MDTQQTLTTHTHTRNNNNNTKILCENLCFQVPLFSKEVNSLKLTNQLETYIPVNPRGFLLLEFDIPDEP